MASFCVSIPFETKSSGLRRLRTSIYACKESLELPPSVVTLRGSSIAPNATVYLVGCLHGSLTSLRDISDTYRIIAENEVLSSVILELCEPRFQSLVRRYQSENDVIKPRSWTSRIDRLGRTVLRPPRVSIVEYALHVVQGISEFFGSRMGLEFIHASRLGGKHQARIVLGDQAQALTIRKLSEGWNLIKNVQHLSEDIRRVSANFHVPQESVDFVRVFFRRESLVSSASAVTMAAIVGLFVGVVEFFASITLLAFHPENVLASGGTDADITVGVLSAIPAVWSIAWRAMYASWTLRLPNALIFERDEVLFHSLKTELRVVRELPE